ncbi:MAG: phosphotransferase [Chitinophagales bacterium]|nr:phosphotransferase [Chitinophagaceae bacterium]MCB9064012.1 phosphotransferase [Chitinophagales bacterium]
MTATITDHINTLEKLFEEHFEIKPESTVPLAVSGSDRRYYRITGGDVSAIGTFNANVAENNSYFYFTDLFRKHEIKVPEVYKVGKERRYYIQQDLGSTSLFDLVMRDGHTEEVKNYFLKATEQLVKVQWRAGTECNYNQCFSSKQFDEKAIMADLMYFKYYFADLQKIPYDRNAIMEEMEQLSKDLGRIQPQTLMYRDFQSRNIMIHEGEVYFIDYQGVMQGPPQYDLASLLWQAKAKIPKAWKEDVLNRYVATMEELKISRVEEIYFRRGYLQFVLLRMMQVLGAYGFRGLLENKPHFRTSIGPALKNMKQFLDDNTQIPTYTGLRALLEAICSDDMQEKYAIAEPTEEIKLKVQINSFSYKKNGIPKDKSSHGGGYVFDCRGIKNPGRYNAYKHLTGQDIEVKQFLTRETRMSDFLQHVNGLVSINVEDYISRGFEHLSVSFGCTGGQHRSVFAAEYLAELLEKNYKVKVTVSHLNQENWVLS